MKKRISIILLIALLFTGIFTFPPEKAHAMTVEKTTTKYLFDLGVTFMWGIGDTPETIVWQDGKYNQKYNYNATLSLPAGAKNISAEKYLYSGFDWDNPNYTFYETDYFNNGYEFEVNYKKFSSQSIENVSCTPTSGNKVKLSYNVLLKSPEDFNVKNKLNIGTPGAIYIYDMLGGEAKVDRLYHETYLKLVNGAANGIAENIYAYMVFSPVVIKYDIVETIEVGDLKADLTLPETAKQNESYTVMDSSILSSEISVDNAVLEKSIDGGDWESVATWEGGEKGKNTGQSINETCADICNITYRLKVTASDGQVDTATKTISILDSRVVTVTAILDTPEYTYEGHPALATDKSELDVNGVTYSARRAYEEKIARNNFETLPGSAGSISSVEGSDTKANVTFAKAGKYDVKLTIKTISGATATDINPIEVRKTPYIIDNLGGVQKENRKQILNISVATYPGKPIADYYIKLRDLKTGGEITLTKDNPQVNDAMLKTRTVKTDGSDSCWTYYTLEFLTKNTSTQDYRYTVYMKDSKGDTDTVQKTFVVNPDLAPNPAISIAGSFMRNKGTNVADIITEDASTTDGDQLKRIWSIGGTDLKTLSGYKDLSFGSEQKVQYSKTGVGKVLLKLDVKDVWNEPTLEEYVTAADHKSASTTAATEVINIAPTVKLEAIETEKADIAIFAEKAAKAEIESGINSLKAALIEAGIDGNVQVLPVATANSSGYRPVGSFNWNISTNCNCCNATGMIFDSEYVYKVQSAGITAGTNDTCIGPHTIYAIDPGDTLTGKPLSTAWSYTVNESNNFGVQLDDQEKYVYITCNDTNKTILLNRNNGAYVTTLNLLMPGKPYISMQSNNLYFLLPDKIQKYDADTGSLTTVVNKGGSLGRIQNGKLTFVGADTPTEFYIGQFDMDAEKLEATALPELPKGTWTQGKKSTITPTDIDTTGKVTFTQTLVNSASNRPSGIFVWLADSKTQAVHLIDQSGAGSSSNYVASNSVGFVTNEKGEAVYMYHGFVNKRIGEYKYYSYLDIYTLGDKNTAPLVRRIYGGETPHKSIAQISYAKLHSAENAIYIMQGGNYGGDTEGIEFGSRCRIYLPSWTIEKNDQLWGWCNFEEQAASNDYMMVAYWNNNMQTGANNHIWVYKNSITAAQAQQSGLQRLGNFREDSARVIEKNYIGNISGLITKIKEELKQKIYTLKLLGDNSGNKASLTKEIPLERGQKYEYEYNMTLLTGSAIDIFRPLGENGQVEVPEPSKVYVEFAAERDFSSSNDESFFTGGISQTISHSSKYEYLGLVSGYYDRKGGPYYSVWIQCNMKNAGYVEFDMTRYSEYYYPYSLSLDGNVIESGNVQDLKKHMRLFLSAGIHRFDLNGTKSGYVSLNNAKAVYTYDTNHTFTPANLDGAAKNKVIKIKNTFYAPREEITRYSNGVKSKSYAALTTAGAGIEFGGYISDFRLYRVNGGLKELALSENFDAGAVMSDWNKTVNGRGDARLISFDKPIKEEDAPLVYKKGDLVAYKIFYDDYEKDPSQTQYWRYTHTPYNDGAHPQAAFVLDEDGKVVSSKGTILSASIPRFYVDGKYTVEHWQKDNTNRTGDTSEKTNYSAYDKLSNVETLTFYIEGGASAPWVTSIKTIPDKVVENGYYKLQIGVDDAEKDVLRLTTEVYKDKKLIYTHKQANISADLGTGVYPYTITGTAPMATSGKYDVVCTVRDASGSGLGSYKFTVVSEGKITGYVNHTDQWNTNRKKFNLSWFKDEINRTYTYSDYMALSTPRKRGANVFWSGEKFVLQAAVAGNPTSVSCQINGYIYAAKMTSTGKKNGNGETIYAGTLWHESMVDKWGRKTPQQLTFTFTSNYSGGTVKQDTANVIVDNTISYWQLHRLF